MRLNKKNFENRFCFVGSCKGDYLIEGRQKPLEVEELLSGRYLVFTTQENIVDFIKARKTSNGDVFNNRVFDVEIDGITFLNFNRLCGCSIQDLKESFGFEVETEAEVMRKYVEFLLSDECGLRRNQLVNASRSTIAEKLMTKGVHVVKPGWDNNNLTKFLKERKYVFNSFKSHLLEKNNMIYGVLDCKPGYYENVYMIDLNNFYGYLQVVGTFIQNNVYKVLKEKEEPVFGYLPKDYRNNIIDNYNKSKKHYKSFFKQNPNLTNGRGMNKGIYLRRSRKGNGSFLGPHISFQVIENGIDLMNGYTKLFEKFGAQAIKRDTDGISFVGITKEQGEILRNAINQQVKETLKNAGIEDFDCGIGQFKFEGFADKYYQFCDKGYAYEIDGKRTIKFSGLKKERKKEIIAAASCFEDVVEALKKENVVITEPGIYGNLMIERTGKNVEFK